MARLFVERAMHKAHAGTGATCLAVAARLPGSVPHAHSTSRERNGPIRIGHPSGVLPIACDVERIGEAWHVNEVVFSRTARRLMEGWAYVRRQRLDAPAQDEPRKAQSDRRLHDSDVVA